MVEKIDVSGIDASRYGALPDQYSSVMNAQARPLPLETSPAGDLVGDVEPLEREGWEGSQQSVAFAYRQAIDALHKAALRPGGGADDPQQDGPRAPCRFRYRALRGHGAGGQPRDPSIRLSAQSGEGLVEWYDWLRGARTRAGVLARP